MGCAPSKIENDEALRRCKDRKVRLKEAVSSRNAFAAAHSSYSVALKNTGAALSDYAHAEAHTDSLRPNPIPTSSSSAPSAVAAAAVQPPIENLPPPPPPLTDFNPPPLQRSASMPDLPIPKPIKKPPADAPIHEEDEDDDNDDMVEHVLDAAAAVADVAASSSPPPPPPPQPAPAPAPSPPPPPMPESKGMEDTWDYFFGMGAENMPMPVPVPIPAPASQATGIQDHSLKKPANPPADKPDDLPEKVVPEPTPPSVSKPLRKQKPMGGAAHHQHAASASAAASTSESKRGRMVPAAARSISFLQVLDELDEHFLKAYESAHDVSKMLEATRMHYHSNFADNRGHIDHSARVMRVITWNRSLKGIPNADDGKDDFNSGESETHATILDKMLAWEKKLYDEVKAGELMKIEYQRKVALLNKQNKRAVSHEVLEKTKSAVSHLHTRYIVDMQSMDSTVSEINHLRDDCLYPKLAELVDGMANMWETMYVHHGRQLKIVAELRGLDMLVAPKETSDQHHDQTIQLWDVLREWHLQFVKLMTHQKAYIGALNSWLKLNLIPIESSLKEKVSSPPRVFQPPIQTLLNAWHDQLEKLPDALASGAISSFSEVVHTIVIHQEDELKHKEKCDEIRREYAWKSRSFEDWYHKHTQKSVKRATPSMEADDAERGEGAIQNDLVEEKKIEVEAVKVRLESELEHHQKICKQVREKSLMSLKTHLPELFRAMSDFSLATSEMYKKLRSISQSQNLEEDN